MATPSGSVTVCILQLYRALLCSPTLRLNGHAGISRKQLLRVVLPSGAPGSPAPTIERWLAEQYPAAPPLPALQPAAR